MPTQLLKHLYIMEKTHTYTHPHIHTPTNYKTHTNTHPHITKPTHTHTHTLQIHTYTHPHTKREHQKGRINELETNSKIKNTTDLHSCINKFMSSNHPRTNTVKDEKDDLVADSYSILSRWRNHFSQLLNAYGINNVRQTEIQQNGN